MVDNEEAHERALYPDRNFARETGETISGPSKVIVQPCVYIESCHSAAEIHSRMAGSLAGKPARYLNNTRSIADRPAHTAGFRFRSRAMQAGESEDETPACRR